MARLLGVGLRTIRHYVHQGKIPQPLVLSRRKWLWDPQAVAEFIRQGRPDGRGGKR
jgi:excisionase family DNA binding protein